MDSHPSSSQAGREQEFTVAGKSIQVCSSSQEMGNGDGSSTSSSCQDLRQVLDWSWRRARTIPGKKPWDGGVGKVLGSCSIPVKSEWFLSKAPVAPGGHGSTQGPNSRPAVLLSDGFVKNSVSWSSPHLLPDPGASGAH